MFEALNSVLQSYKLKPIKEHQFDQDSHDDKPCIVFFGMADEKVVLLLAASKILPECAFIVPEPTWTKVVQSGENTVLYLLEGISANEFGQLFHTKFQTPRKITFICNFYTEGAFSFDETIYQDKAKKFNHLESLSDCPMSSGAELDYYTDDKLHTRLLAAARNVNVPQTIAFCFSLEKYSHHPVNSKIKLLTLSKYICDDEIREYLTAFPVDKFVIKPSGTRWMAGRLCTIESKDNLDRAVENFKKCLDSLQDNDCLLVEEFIDSSITDNCNLGARLRVLVTRRPNNVAETSGIVCNLGYLNQPINGSTSEEFSIDYVCSILHLTNDDKNKFIKKIEGLGKTVLESIIDYENQHLTHLPQNKQTDFIGLDVFVKKINNKLEAFLIEVNNHDSFVVVQDFEIQHAPSQSHILNKWIETMLYRSYQYMLRGKNILMLGSGCYSKLNVFEFANRSGVNIILVDNSPQNFAVDYSTQCFNIEIDDHTQDLQNALNIVDAIYKNNITIDGTITFWEDNVPLCALVTQLLGKSSNDYISASIAKSKLLTHKKILIEHQNQLFYKGINGESVSNGAEVFTLKNAVDIYTIPQRCYPLVIKLDTGSCAFGVEVIQTEEELLAKFEDYKDYIQTSVHTGVGLGFNYKIIATPYLQGSEHDIDLIMFDGELVAGYVSDNGPTMPSLCREMTAIMPSVLDKEKQDNLIRAAWKACRSIGLKDGVFHVEAIYTLLEVKILEINARMGGFDTANCMFNIWDVNLILYSYLIACGIKPFVNKNNSSRIYYNSFQCYASLHKQILNVEKLKELSSVPGFSVSILEKEIPPEQKYEEPYASVAICSENIAEAKRKMKKFLDEHDLQMEEYNFICDK